LSRSAAVEGLLRWSQPAKEGCRTAGPSKPYYVVTSTTSRSFLEHDQETISVHLFRQCMASLTYYIPEIQEVFPSGHPYEMQLSPCGLTMPHPLPSTQIFKTTQLKCCPTSNLYTSHLPTNLAKNVTCQSNPKYGEETNNIPMPAKVTRNATAANKTFVTPPRASTNSHARCETTLPSDIYS